MLLVVISMDDDIRKIIADIDNDIIDLQSLMDAVPFYVMLVDSNHRILMANRMIEKALDLHPGSIIGGYCPKVVHGLEDPYPGCPLEEALDTGNNIEREFYDADQDRWVRSAVYSTGRYTKQGLEVFLHYIVDISERKRVEQEIKQSYDTQSVINSILNLSLKDTPLEEILSAVMDMILSIPWMVVEPKGAIFITEPGTDKLVLTAMRDLHRGIPECCGILPIGQCLCGRAAQSGEIQYADHVNHLHEIQCEGILPHGHYCAPINFGEENLGVINLYLKEGKSPDQREKDFLVSVCNALAGIIKRHQVDEALKKRERELQIKTESLTEMNTALTVLLKKRDEDRTEMEEKVLSNIKKLVVNYVERLRNSGLNPKQAGLVDVLESNLNNIISPFSQSLTFKFHNLTPLEIQVADMVRQGKTTKEIASYFDLSPRTIDFHRQNIRDKLGLKDKKANLRSYLLSFK